MRAIGAAAGLATAVWLAPIAPISPIASAEIAVLHERPNLDGLVFTGNPAIVDPHPMRAESYSRTADERVLAVHFTTGTPQCYGVDATVRETADTVTVELRGGTLPEAVDRACILIAVGGTLDVPLASPLGARQVLTAF